MPEVILTLDSSGAIKGLRNYENEVDRAGKKTDSAFSKMRSGVNKIGAAFGLMTAAVGSALAVVAVDMVKLAGNLAETQNKFDVVFKGMTGTAEEWATTLQKDYALTENASKKFLASTQDLLKPMGIAADQAGKMSFEVSKLAVDLGSFNGLPTEKVMDDIQSALVGNYETMKKYGVVVSATSIVQEALNTGLVKNAKDLTASQKAQIAFNQITRASTDAIGNWNRSQGSFNNQLKIFDSNLETIKTRLGEQLLPYANKWLTVLNEWAGDQTNINKIILYSVEAVEFLYNGIKGLELAAKGIVVGFAWAFEKIVDYVTFAIKPLDMLIAGFVKLGWVASNPLQDLKNFTADFTASAVEGFKSTWKETEITNSKFEVLKKKVMETGTEVKNLTEKNKGLTDSFKEKKPVIDSATNSLEENKNAAENLVTSHKEVADATDLLSDATEQATTSYESLLSSTTSLRDESDALINTTDKLTKSLKEVSKASASRGGGMVAQPNEGEGQLSYFQRLGIMGVALEGNSLRWNGSKWVMNLGKFEPGRLKESDSLFSANQPQATTNINVNQKVSRSDIVSIASELNRMEQR